MPGTLSVRHLPASIIAFLAALALAVATLLVAGIGVSSSDSAGSSWNRVERGSSWNQGATKGSSWN